MAWVGELYKNGSDGRPCFSPRRIIGRWMGSLRRNKERKVEKESCSEGVVRDSGNGSTCARCSVNGLNDGNSLVSVPDGEGSGLNLKGTSFNVGVGCSLLYLLTASKIELSKMAELRSEMEIMLKNAKEEWQTKEGSLRPIQTETNLSHSRSSYDAQDGSCSISQGSVQRKKPFQVSSDLRTKEPNFFMTSDTNEEEEDGIDELAAEFETELERLQIHLDREDRQKSTKLQMIQNLPKQQNIKASVKDTPSTRSFSASSGEVINPMEEVAKGQSGVSPRELERRLHELLEEKQLERIQELEAALECAKQEIKEKDMEISWWKDTAKLLSHHVPEPSRLLLTSQSAGERQLCEEEKENLWEPKKL